MGLRSNCTNCGATKTPEYYAAPYCADCTKIVDDSRAWAIENNLNPSDVQRSALGERAHSIFAGRHDPRLPTRNLGS